jgi:hypothetical protein
MLFISIHFVFLSHITACRYAAGGNIYLLFLNYGQVAHVMASGPWAEHHINIDAFVDFDVSFKQRRTTSVDLIDN